MIYLKEIKKNKDGSADYTFDYDEEFIKFYKEKTGKTSLEDKEVGKFIIKYLKKLVGEPKKNSKRTPKKKVK